MPLVVKGRRNGNQSTKNPKFSSKDYRENEFVKTDVGWAQFGKLLTREERAQE